MSSDQIPPALTEATARMAALLHCPHNLGIQIRPLRLRTEPETELTLIFVNGLADRLKGFLTVDETQMLLALRGEMGKAYVSIPDPAEPDLPVSMRFHQENLPR